MNSYRTSIAAETRKLGYRFGQKLVPGDIISLTGPMGAGKTVLIQGIAEALNITEAVTSPTFTIINEYVGTLKLFHLDLYRLASLDEIVWLGVEEMLDGSNVCLFEWGEKAESILPPRTIWIKIKIMEDDTRCIEVYNKKELWE